MTALTQSRAAVFTAPGAQLALENIRVEAPGPGEVLVRMSATGICHTDLGVMDGHIGFPAPGILGHEGAGIVTATGDGVRSVAPGDHVVLSYTSCGLCTSCRAGDTAYCATWVPRNIFGGLRADESARIWGEEGALSCHFFGQSSFAELAIVDERSVVRVDSRIDPALLAPLGCGVLTGVGSMWNVLDPGHDDVVAVWGAGAVGLAAVMAASLRKPAQLLAIDIIDSRLDLARELGATATINPSREDVADRLSEITEGRGVTRAFDTTGVPAIARTAMDAASARGMVVVCGATAPGVEIAVEARDMLSGKSLRGVTMGDADPHVLIPQLVVLQEAGILQLERLIERFPFSRIQDAVDAMRGGRVVKPVVVF